PLAYCSTVASGVIEFRRPLGGTGALATFKVVVDGLEVLQLRSGESARFDVVPGEHTIEARAANRPRAPPTVLVSESPKPLVIEMGMPGFWAGLQPGSYKRRKESISCTLVALPPPPS